MKNITFAIFLIIISVFTNVWAQLYAPNEAGVSMGHLHYFVKDMKQNHKFWIDLGAHPVMMGKREVLKFPGVMILLTDAESSGGSDGSIINHVAFRVSNVIQELKRLEAAGYKTELSNSGTGKVGNVYSPEGDKVELMEDMSINVKFEPDNKPYVTPSKMNVPIDLHHIHYYLPEKQDVIDAKAWYVKHFSAIPGKRYKTVLPPYEAADLPGVNLNFSAEGVHAAPTKGRKLDHIGFEIENLEEFCKKLERMGVKLDRPYSTTSSGLGIAFFTDPWGVYVELTEGLDNL